MKSVHEGEEHQSPGEKGITIINKEALHNWLLSGSSYPTFSLFAAQLRHRKQSHTVKVPHSLTFQVTGSQMKTSQPYSQSSREAKEAVS